jgi:hypothetical protein
MQANGMMEQKLAAIVQMNKDQWEAIGGYTGNWVPLTVMGGGNGGGSGFNGAQSMLELMTVQNANKLGLDMSVQGGNKGQLAPVVAAPVAHKPKPKAAPVPAVVK